MPSHQLQRGLHKNCTNLQPLSVTTLLVLARLVGRNTSAGTGEHFVYTGTNLLAGARQQIYNESACTAVNKCICVFQHLVWL